MKGGGYGIIVDIILGILGGVWAGLFIAESPRVASRDYSGLLAGDSVDHPTAKIKPILQGFHGDRTNGLWNEAASLPQGHCGFASGDQLAPCHPRESQNHSTVGAKYFATICRLRCLVIADFSRAVISHLR
jgi:hypothetical protein